MGNEQSQEQAQTEGDLDIDEQDSFDLEAIEDSREYLARPTSNRSTSSPAEPSIMARDAAGKFKKKKKKIRKGPKETTSQDTACPPISNAQAEDQEEPDGFPVMEGAAEADGGFEELRRREPEQWGDYDSSDESEYDKEKVLPSRERTNGLGKEILKSDLKDEDDKDSSSLSEANAVAEYESPGDLNRHGAHTDPTLDNAVTPASQRKTRYLCPHAEEYDCSKTFSRGETARRHGKSHTCPFVCPFCQKQLSRQDSLNYHLKQHSTEEIANTGKSAVEVIEANDGVSDGGGPATAAAAAADDASDRESAPPVVPTELAKNRFPCPLASPFRCDKTYLDEKEANRHAQVHTTDLSCPLGCLDPKTGEVMTFCHERSRNRHLKNRHTPEDRKKAKAMLLAWEAEAADVVPDDEDSSRAYRRADADGLRSNLDEPAKETVVKPADSVQRDELDELAIGLETNLVDEGALVDERGDNDLENAMDVDTSEHNTSKPAGKPQGHSNGKRKRNDHTSSPAVPEESAPRKKLRQRQLTPASPDPAQEHLKVKSKFIGVFLGTPDKTRAREQGESTGRRQSRINNFVQPYVAGSTLRHPLFHPESPDLRKHVRTGSFDEQQANGAQGRSSTRRKKKAQATPRVAVTTKNIERAVSVDEDNDHERPVNGVGASGAENASAIPTPKSKSKRRKVVSEDPKSDEFETEQAGSSTQGLARKGRGVTPLIATRNVVCRTCKRKFKNQHRLELHESNPKSHKSLLECEECDEQFYHISDLRKHEEANRHEKAPVKAGPSGRRFSTLEEATIQRWARLFREEHDLPLEEFKEMMQASYRRNKEWSYDFITKSEFTQEYFDLLPERDIASMRRYRDKHFNVADTSEVWSTYEDDEIIRLHEELGPRWAKIGKDLNRPGEMVRQRYKNKLSLASMATGDWTKLEETAFREAVEQVRRVSEVAAGSFNWSAVSKKMQTRTPQQCANHWRAKYAGTRIGDLWKSNGETPTKIPHDQLRSKMEQRLAGEPSSSPKKLKVVSQEYVTESEDEEDADAKDDDPQKEGSGSGKRSHKSEQKSASPEGGDDEEDVTRPRESESEPDDEEGDEKEDEPELPRHPLADITPGKTLRMSQVFNQTQANTSAKRLSPHRGSQERPSPNIAIQYQRERSPELGTPDEDLDEIDRRADEKATVSADGDDDKENILRSAGQGEVETKSEEDDGYVSTESDSESNSESDSEQIETKQASASRSDTATKTTASIDSESDSESESNSSAASKSSSNSMSNSSVKSESNSTTASPSHSQPPWPAGKARPSPSTQSAHNKKLAEVSNAFMDSINATVSTSARKRDEAQMKQKGKGSRRRGRRLGRDR